MLQNKAVLDNVANAPCQTFSDGQKMKQHLKERWPDWLMAIGLAWMIGLTAFNIFYTYYGWFPIANDHYAEEIELKKETVNDLFVTFGSNASDYVGQQLYPLALIIVAAFGYSIHNHKLRKSIQSELDNPISAAGKSENH